MSACQIEDHLALTGAGVGAGLPVVTVGGSWHPGSSTFGAKSGQPVLVAFFSRTNMEVPLGILSGCNVSGCVAPSSLP